MTVPAGLALRTRAVRPAGPALAALPAFTLGPLTALAGLLVLSAAAPGATRAAALPLAVVGMALGVPHGAVDHLVAWWRPGAVQRAAPRTSLLLLALGYVAVAVVAGAALLLAGQVALPLLLALSAWHFGRGEVAAWAERAGLPVPRWNEDLVPALAHGAAVVGLLLWARPADTLRTAGALSGDLQPLVAQRATGLAVLTVLVLAALAVLLSRQRRVEALELALVVAVFATAPPLAAFGVYFAAWHALRHTGRLLDLARQAGDATWRPAARRLLVAGAAPSAVAWAAMLLLWREGRALGPEAQVSILLALTAPHAVVVAALDHARGAAAPAARL